MTKEEAIKDAKRRKMYFPYRIIFIAGKNGEWESYDSVTKAKLNNMVRKGYEVYQLT